MPQGKKLRKSIDKVKSWTLQTHQRSVSFALDISRDLTTATSATTPQINDLIGWMKKNNRAARAARFFVQCFDVVCQTTTWNFHIWGSDDIASPQQWIFHSLPLYENHLCQKRESAVRLFCTTWPTWNNRKRLNSTHSSIFMWRFGCSCRHSFLNSLIFINTVFNNIALIHYKYFRFFFQLNKLEKFLAQRLVYS